jgi:opacity protein-like surface antigen
MKKLILTAAIATLFSASVFAADGGKKVKETATVSYAVQNQFNADFSDAKDVAWSVSKNFQKAEFTSNGVKMTAFYNFNGEFIGLTQNADLKAIPAKTRKEIAAQYGDYTISQLIVYQVNSDLNPDVDPVAYFVDLKSADHEVLVRINQSADIEFFKQVK